MQEIVDSTYSNNPQEGIFVPVQNCPYHVTFDLDLDLEHIMDADLPGDHRVQVWWRSGHLPARSDWSARIIYIVYIVYIVALQTYRQTSLPLSGEVINQHLISDTVNCKYTVSQKNCANLFFVRTLPNFDRL